MSINYIIIKCIQKHTRINLKLVFPLRGNPQRLKEEGCKQFRVCNYKYVQTMQSVSKMNEVPSILIITGDL